MNSPAGNTAATPRKLRRSQQPAFERLPPIGLIPRYELYHFHSSILPDDRSVFVYLPPQYAEEPARRFPVFYLHDGQNLIDPQTSYLPGRTWRAGEAADTTNAEHTAEPVILVGIANTGLRRMPEYTPTRDFRMGGGEGNQYGRVLIQELKPFIDRTYRTLPGAAHTGLGGSSLGGLISLYLGLKYSLVFGNLAVLSPSIWWDHRSILTLVQAARPRPNVRIWLDIGTGEGARHVRDTETLNRILVAGGWQPDHDLHFALFPDALHDENAWAARFPQVLEFLFPAPTDLQP